MMKSIRPFFFGAKFLGTNLYEIKGHDIIVSKSKIALYILVQFINISCTATTIHVNFHDTYNTKEQIFLITRTIISYISLLIELIITIYWKNKLSSAMTNVLMYDISAKYNEKIHYCTLNWGRCVFVLLMTWWIIIGFVNYNLTSNYAIISGLGYTFFYGGVCMQILQFAGLTLMLYRRFDHLCRLILPEDLLIKTNVKVIGEALGTVKLEDVWMMHFNLTRAAEKFNYVWSFQLLLWLFSLSLNTLSRLYTLVNPQIHEELLMIRDGMCAVGFLMTLMILIISCHLTSQRANQVAEKVFLPISTIKKKSSQHKDNNQAQSYFYGRKLQFTASGGFIYIELPLLISIMGAISTYLVILYKASEKNIEK